MWQIETLKLYIPHGSDNTETEDGGTETVTPLYIPHGSDNTNAKVIYFN